MADLLALVVEISLGLFFVGIFMPIGITAILNYLGNLSGTNAELWSYLVTFAIIAIVLYMIAPAIRQARGMTGRGR